MAKFTRKGKNPGPVDSWLDALGYYRKNIAYDETCLFRAVSEQMFLSQIYHERVRKECISYGRQNYYEFLEFFDTKELWDKHLDQLNMHMAICGNVEILLISHTYKKDLLVFDGIARSVIDVKTFKSHDRLLLCLMGEDHYDVVYEREHIKTAGFCQSIVYSILYENVFEIPKVSKIVQAMLYEKPTFLMTHSEYFDEACVDKREELRNMSDSEVQDMLQVKREITETGEENTSNWTDYDHMLHTNIAPFPFKVAKALDPTIYRNIEYDTWTETRKELRLGDWYYGDNNLILGTCCLLKTENGILQCYIQDIIKEENKCVVYVTSLAEKRTVKYSELSPESDAKPWPLPYRFAKNVVIIPPKLQLLDKEKKGARKRREKKRTNSKSSQDGVVSPTTGLADGTDPHVNAFEGCPLQMQQCEEFQRETNEIGSALAQTPYQEDSLPSEANWDQATPNSAEPIVWQQIPTTPQTMFPFGPKPMLTPPQELPYSDQPVYYNMNRYQAWNNAPEYMLTEQSVPQSPQQAEVSPSSDHYAYSYYPENVYVAPNCVGLGERPMCTTPLTPTSPQVEIFQPVYSVPPPPITPLVYTTQDIPEMMMTPPSPLPMYSPGFEMSYVTPNAFIYPTTPPAWYPPFNSQGFIFPVVNAPNVPNRM